MRLTMLMTGAAIVSFIAFATAIVFAFIGSEYAVEYDNSTIERFNYMENLTTQTKNISSSLEQTGEPASSSTIIDILGGATHKVIQTVKLGYASIGVVEDMSRDALVGTAWGGRVMNQFNILIGILLIIGIIAGLIYMYTKVKG